MKKLHIHIGLAKTGTTFLQDVVFPQTTFCYLGKALDIHKKSDLDVDPFMFFKYLLNSDNSGSCFAKMPIAKDQIEQFTGLYGYYRDMMREEQVLLLSDESFTANPLNRFMRFIIKICSKEVGDARGAEASYRIGFSLAEHFFGSSDGLSLSFKEQLLSSNFISLKIQKCLDALDVELGSILLLDRDFGSWFVSYFLQFLKVERESLGFLGGVISPDIVFASAGFAVYCDQFLKDRSGSGFVFASSFSDSIQRDFGSNVLNVVQYSSDSSVFWDNLQPVLSVYGVSSAICEKARQSKTRINATHLGQCSFQGEAEILRSRSLLSRRLNSFAGI